MRSPLLRGEELDDLEQSTREAVELREAGIDALVELTTIGLGRDPRGVADIAAHSGLHIVLATGIHREAHYPPEHWVHRTAPEELAELFIRDITEGCESTDYSGPREQPTRIRAGVIKVGAGYWTSRPSSVAFSRLPARCTEARTPPLPVTSNSVPPPGRSWKPWKPRVLPQSASCWRTSIGIPIPASTPNWRQPVPT